MIQMKLAIVLGDKVLTLVQASGRTSDECYDRAFEYADMMFGSNEHYELCDLTHPRHQVLFKDELNQLFREC